TPQSRPRMPSRILLASRSIWGWVVVGDDVIDFRPLRVSSRFILVFHILSPDRVEPARMNRRSPSRGRFANLCRPLNESAPSHLIQWFAKLGLCPEVFFYHKDCEPLALAAQQRGARIGPACAVRAARVGRLQPTGEALVTALRERILRLL